MKKFEYKIEYYSYNFNTKLTYEPDRFEDDLNELASEGWELVNAVSLPEQYSEDQILAHPCQGNIVLFLKREVTE